MQDLGNSCIQLVQNAGTVQHNPTDNYAKKDLTDNAKVVSEKVGSYFVSVLLLTRLLLIDMSLSALALLVSILLLCAILSSNL